MARRELTTLEIPYVTTNTTSGGGFVVRGNIDADRLAAAFAALRREFPYLAGRIEPTKSGFDVVADDHPREEYAPLQVQKAAFAAGDVVFGLDPFLDVSALQLISDGTTHRVTIGVNHALADGAHAAGLNLRLWQLYTHPESEVAPTAQLPLSPLDVAHRLGTTAAPTHNPITAFSNGSIPSAAAVDAGEFGYERIQLDQHATTALRAGAKAAGLSLHGLLAGIITTAERAELDYSADQAVPMAVFSPVDLRSRCTPPVAVTSVTNFAGSSTTPVEVRGDTAAEEIGRTVLARLNSDLSDGTVVATLTGTGGVQVSTGAPVRLSNLGAMAAPTLPADLTAVDFYTSSDVNIHRVRELVRTLPAHALQALVGLHFHAMTFAGQLSIEMRFAPGTVDQTQVERIRDRIGVHLLGKVGAPA